MDEASKKQQEDILLKLLDSKRGHEVWIVSGGMKYWGV